MLLPWGIFECCVHGAYFHFDTGIDIYSKKNLNNLNLIFTSIIDVKNTD